MADLSNSPGILTAIVGRLADLTGSQWGQKLYASMRGQENDLRARVGTGAPEKPMIAASLPAADFPAQHQLPMGRGPGSHHL